MRLSEANPFKACANPQAHSQKLSRANVYENEMVQTNRDLNRSGASPNMSSWRKWFPLQIHWSGKSQVLVSFRFWSFNMHAAYILSADDLGDFSGVW